MRILTLACWLFLFNCNLAQANNFYLGLGTGVDNTNYYKTLTIENLQHSQLYDKKDNLSGSGYLGHAIMGYHMQFGQFQLNTELSAQLNSVKYHGYFYDLNNDLLSYATFTMKQNYNISLLPGYMLTDYVLLFARIGIDQGQFHYAEYKISHGNTLGLAENKWLTGLRLGIGTAIDLTKTSQLRLEYNHVQYQPYRDNSFPLDPQQIRTITLTPKTKQFNVSFIYHLN